MKVGSALKDQDIASSSHELPMDSRAEVEPGSDEEAQCPNALSEGPKSRYLFEDEIQGLVAEDVLVQSCPERNILVT